MMRTKLRALTVSGSPPAPCRWKQVWQLAAADAALRDSSWTNRRGATLGECMVALVILATAVVSTAQLTVAVMAQQRLGLEQQIARQEVANLMERIFALPAAQMSAETLSGLELSTAARQRLHGVRHSATVGGPEGSPPCRRVLVEVQWTNSAGRPARPVRLVTWRYGAEAQP